MYRKKRKHRHEEDFEKERLPRSKAHNRGQPNSQLDPVAVQQARTDPTALKPDDVQQLQGMIGNKVIKRMLAKKADSHGKTLIVPQGPGKIIQRAGLKIVVEESNTPFKSVAGYLTSGGNIDEGFGFTFPMKISQLKPELRGEISTFAGLRKNMKDVDEEGTTEKNWEDKIIGLASMGIKNEWYSKEAVQAHEAIHVMSFRDITDNKEQEIKNSSSNEMALAKWRRICDRQGAEDHKNGSTDNAELEVIKKKIEKIWMEAQAFLPKTMEQKTFPIESQYQKARKFLIIGKSQNKVLATATLRPKGQVEW